MRAKLPDTALATETLTLVREGILGGLSVEMRVRSETWNGKIRTIRQADLHRFSVVDTPAYEGATVSMRAKEYLEGLDVTARPLTRIIQLQ